MGRILLNGHRETAVASQMVRLFYGDQLEISDNFIAGDFKLDALSSLEHLPQSPDRVRIRTQMGENRLEGVVARKMAKREIARQLYFVLSQEEQINLPWGSLTGIRPTVIASEYLNDGMDEATVREKLKSHWFVKASKAALCVETALAEQRILNTIPPEKYLLYVGIPFCPSRCAYCSFITRDSKRYQGQLAAYVAAVLEEAAIVSAGHKLAVSAFYLGGGTPTTLSADQLDLLLTGLGRHFDLSAAEITCEAGRPDTFSRDKLEVLKSAGVQRICINPQSMHDKTLALIGRNHTVAQTLAAFALARDVGFRKINMDLIAGLPAESADDFSASLQQVISLDPSAITVHTLALKRSARLAEKSRDNSAFKPDLRPDVVHMLEDGYQRLTGAGYSPYYLYRQKRAAGGLENTAFARPGGACLYNVGMMSDRRAVIGLGCGAASKLAAQRQVKRLTNPRDAGTYLGAYIELGQKKRTLFFAD